MSGNASSRESMPGPDRISTKRDFGRELTLQRDRVGLSVREVARALGIPTSTISDYFRGESLPRGPLLRKILFICGVEDEADVERWLDALNRARRAPGPRPADAPVPYWGLESYQSEDADWFFGRELLTAILIDHLRRQFRHGGPLAVVGASGSGKSSLLRAGLIAELESGGLGVLGSHIWPVTVLTPGSRPVRELATQLAALTGDDPDRLESMLLTEPAECADLANRAARWEASGDGDGGTGDPGQGVLVLVVDQFEEVFTACPDEHERLAFIAALCAAAGTASTSTRPAALVVLGLRADFYPQALGYPALVAALQSSQVVVGPMTAEELRSAITEPARKAALDIEDGLVELVLRDLAPSVGRTLSGAAHDPGALPMLSFALLATWARSRGGKLTVASYLDSGGIRGAVASAAEKVYHKQLDVVQQDLARRIFIRLVHVADDTADTRRRVPRSELLFGDHDVQPVLDAFIGERLITAETDNVEIAHEALLLAWPRLREWVNGDRPGVRVHRQLTAAAEVWRDSGRDQDALYSGGRLAAVEEWVGQARHADNLNKLEREFLDASTEHKLARERAARHRTWRLQALASVLAVLSLVVGVLAIVAYQQKSAATYQRDVAISRQIATEADQLRSTDIALAMQLSLASYRISPTTEARSSLLNSTATVAATRMLGTVGTEMHSVAFNLGQTILATGNADGTVRLWDVRKQGHPVALGPPLKMPSGAVTSVVFSPDGAILAAGTLGGAIGLWDVRDSSRPVLLDLVSLPSGSAVNSVAYSPGGLSLAAASSNGRIYLWDVSSPRHAALLGAPAGAGIGPVNAVAFSRDADMLAAGGNSGRVRVWKLAPSGRPAGVGLVLSGPAKAVNAVAFSLDGAMLAAGANDDKVWLWNIADGPQSAVRLPPLTGAASWIYSVAFSPAGNTLAAGSADDTAYIWNLAGGAPLARLPHPAPVLSVGYGRDGDTLATGDADGIARIWSLPGPLLTGPKASVFNVAFSPDSGNLAVASGDGTVRLWAVSGINQAQPLSPPMTAAGQLDGTVAYGAGGRLAAGGSDGSIQLWDVRDARHPVRLPAPPTALNTSIQYVIFNATGHLMAAGSLAGSIELWDVTDFAHPRVLAVIPADAPGPGHTTWALAFSSDSRLLAAAGGDGLVRLWDITDPSHPRQVGQPLTRLSSAVFQVTFSPHGRLLAASGEDGMVRLWDVTDADHPRLLTTLSASTGTVYDVSFSPDALTLASANTDGTVSMWNIANPAAPASLGSLAGLGGTVFSAAFSPTANVLAAGSQDGSTRLWLATPVAAASYICSITGAPITRSEWQRYIPGLPYDPPCAALSISGPPALAMPSDADSDRGSRVGQVPASAASISVRIKSLNSSGSSRLSTCPEFGTTASPAVGIVRLSSRPGSRQASSSSPLTTSVGAVMPASWPVMSYRGGRDRWIPMTVRAMPSAECSASCPANSSQTWRFLRRSWIRFGPMACLAPTAAMPSARKAAAICSVSARKAARPPGLAPLPALATSSEETRSA
jgi:WD40 repeat protein/transcriptional regulator with XRE-family HTH domain